MAIWHAIVLGIVQGLTEFLPVSSSGHLIILSEFLGWPEPSTYFSIALHLGTLLAVIIYFAKDWVRIILKERAMLWSILIATFATGVIGLFVAGGREDIISPRLTAWMLIIFGLLLWLVDMRAKVKSRKVPTIGQSVMLGVAQAIALIPGVSRSGIVMTAARGIKMSRTEAAKYAFLLSAPIILLSPLISLTNLIPGEAIGWADLVGFLTSFIFGWMAIAWLMYLVKRVSFGWFAGYRILLAVLILFLLN